MNTIVTITIPILQMRKLRLFKTSVERKKELLPFVTVWMELESIMLSEISQSEKDKYHLISLICGI